MTSAAVLSDPTGSLSLGTLCGHQLLWLLLQEAPENGCQDSRTYRTFLVPWEEEVTSLRPRTRICRWRGCQVAPGQAGLDGG